MLLLVSRDTTLGLLFAFPVVALRFYEQSKNVTSSRPRLNLRFENNSYQLEKVIRVIIVKLYCTTVPGTLAVIIFKEQRTQ